MIPFDPAGLTRGNFVARLAAAFESEGARAYLGEPLTLAEHMLQAATLAEEREMDDEIIVAALLHDIGHLVTERGACGMEDAEDRHHGEVGAKVLQGYLPPVVVDCVRHHVAAKRYLCARKPAYLNGLSRASLHSLNLQGGPMNEEEAAAFERIADIEKMLQVRRLDEAGKTPGRRTPGFRHFAPLVQRLVDRHTVSGG